MQPCRPSPLVSAKILFSMTRKWRGNWTRSIDKSWPQRRTPRLESYSGCKRKQPGRKKQGRASKRKESKRKESKRKRKESKRKRRKKKGKKRIGR